MLDTYLSTHDKNIFFHIIESSHVKERETHNLYAACLDTPLGLMLAIGDKRALYLLEFLDKCDLKREIEGLCKKMQFTIAPGWTQPLESIKQELTQYFNGTRTQFNTPIVMLGSAFQKQVWEALLKIPAGTTFSYTDLAQSINRPKSVRAVANANGANKLAILIPCHRVIQRNGDLGGYAGGVAKKQWLLNFECL